MAIYKDENELLNTDWQAKINDAVAKGDYTAAAQYEQARNDKINNSGYKGKQTTTNNYSQYLPVDPWKQYAGTNFHQDAIDAAMAGNWDAVTNALNMREQKVAAQGGDNRGKTSAEIYAELWNQYGAQVQKPTYNYNVSQPTYTSQYDSRIDDLLNEILTREDFSYDAAADPLYQQYQSQYQREGNRAMNDTLASAAANAGGMNSYAVTAAQQANNYYAAQMGDKIPELYQLAYEMYLQDIDSKVRDMGLLQDMDNTQYNRYRDTMSDWRDDRDFAYTRYRDAMGDYQWQTSFDYQIGRDDINDAWREKEWDYGVSQDTLNNEWREKEWNYGVEQDSLVNDRDASDTAYNRALDLISAGVMPDDAMLQAAGLSAEKAAAMIASLKANGVTSGGGGSSSGGSSGGSSSGGSGKGSGGSGSGKDGDSEEAGSGAYAGNEGIDAEIIKKMQGIVGADPDGKWGKNSSAAAGGMSASEAYKAYKAGTLKKQSRTYDTSALKSDEAALYVDSLYGVGAVDIDDDGKVVWAKGWSHLNWYEKLRQSMNNSIYQSMHLIQ